MQHPSQMEVSSEKEKVEQLGNTGKEKPLTREQQRRKERIEAEANEVFSKACERFDLFIINSDTPEGQEVVDKQREISAQWRLYCKRKQLLPSAYSLVDEHCVKSIKEFYEIKNAPQVTPMPEAATLQIPVPQEMPERVEAKDLPRQITTFAELVQYGKDSGANIVEGMPWSFRYCGYDVTHENNELYLIPVPTEGYTIRLSPGFKLVTGGGEHPHLIKE
jgi:hypothetical protein